MNNIKIGCEVFLRNGKFILLGKRKNCYGAETGALPGGHLEHGETLDECARRELKEELGIEVPTLLLKTIVNNIDERGHYIHVSFEANSFLGEIKCMEPELCYEWQWFDIEKLPQEIFKPHKKILNTYKNNIIYKN